MGHYLSGQSVSLEDVQMTEIMVEELSHLNNSGIHDCSCSAKYTMPCFHLETFWQYTCSNNAHHCSSCLHLYINYSELQLMTVTCTVRT